MRSKRNGNGFTVGRLANTNHRLVFAVALFSLSRHPAIAAPPSLLHHNLRIEGQIPESIAAVARKWIVDLKHGHINAADADRRVAQQLTPQWVHREQRILSQYGRPLSFTYLTSDFTRETHGYWFVVVFEHGRMLEGISFDNHGRVAGLDFTQMFPTPV